MKIGSIQFPVFKPYNSAAIEFYIAGCNNRCSGCCNPELADFNNGEEITSTTFEYIKERLDMIGAIGILGGDILCQDRDEAESFIKTIREMDKHITLWLFTGKDSLENHEWVYKYFDVIKYGKYDEKLKYDGFPASTNQKIIRKNIDY